MPNYIIAETYIHLDLDYSKGLEKVLKGFMKYHAEIYSKEYFKFDVDLVYIVEEGSLKSRVYAITKNLVYAIIIYGGLRTGIDYAVHDSYFFSDKIITAYRNEITDADCIIRAERRTGLTGKIKRLFDKAYQLEANSINMLHDEYEYELNKLVYDATRIYNTLNKEERRVFLNELPELIRRKLPRELPIDPNLVLNRYVIREDKRRRLDEYIEPRQNLPNL